MHTLWTNWPLWWLVLSSWQNLELPGRHASSYFQDQPSGRPVTSQECWHSPLVLTGTHIESILLVGAWKLQTPTTWQEEVFWLSLYYLSRDRNEAGDFQWQHLLYSTCHLQAKLANLGKYSPEAPRTQLLNPCQPVPTPQRIGNLHS